MARQFAHQSGQSAHRTALAANHAKHQNGDCEAAQDKDDDLDNVRQRHRFQPAIERIEQRKSCEHGHAREHTKTCDSLDGQRATIQDCGQIDRGEQEDPEHGHDRFHAGAKPGLEELWHRVDAAFEEDGQEEGCNDD